MILLLLGLFSPLITSPLPWSSSQQVRRMLCHLRLYAVSSQTVRELEVNLCVHSGKGQQAEEGEAGQLYLIR